MRGMRAGKDSTVKSLAVFLFLMFLPVSVWAADYYVAPTGDNVNNGSAGAPWKTITYALDQAIDGDIIHVASGTYSVLATGESFPLNMKQGVSLSGANRDTTILDAASAASVIYAAGVSSGTLSNFTITNGKATQGGGINIVNSGINITNNIIKNNEAASGAAINGSSFSGAISGNSIINNLATDVGGGVRLVDSSGSISENLVSSNSSGAGGGLYVINTTSSITANQITRNKAYTHGGGLYIADYVGSVDRNTILSNEATTGSGGGLYAVNFSGSINNNLIARNVADAVGGLYASDFDVNTEIINNTIADNVGTLTESVGGMQVAGVSAIFKNNIFWNNGADDLYGGLTSALAEESVGISYSLINDYVGTNNNIYADPVFVNAAGNDYSLTAGSPAIDAGTATGAPTLDIAGNARSQGAGVDMGAYEYAYVPPVGGGTVIVKAFKYTISIGWHPSITKEPLVGLVVGLYTKAPAGCAAGYGFSWRHYDDVVANCTPDYSGVTDANGELILEGVTAGDYLVIGGDGTRKRLGKRITVVDGETVIARLCAIITRWGKWIRGRSSRHTGSELLVVEPENIEWESSEELYPFVFETLDEWSVTVDITPPAGYVADHTSLSEEVTNEVEALQFTITETSAAAAAMKAAAAGTEILTGVTLNINHEATNKTVETEIPGVKVVPSGKLIIQARIKYARKGKAKIPLADLLVGVYDKSAGSCAAGIGTSLKNWPEIIAGCTADYSDTTDAEGKLEFNPITVGKYLIIGGDGTDKHLGAKADIAKDETVTKRLTQKVKKDKDKDAGRRSGKDQD